MIIAVEVKGVTAKKIPAKNETIEDDFFLDKLVSIAKEVKIHFRSKESCPWGRGNWVIDIHADNKLIPEYCIRLPPEMSKEHVMRWVKPLLDKMREKMN